jgi:hypothetical protein
MALGIVSCNAPKEADYKLGMGVVVSMESSKTGNAQVDATVATVVTDADGKIVLCRIDVAQNKMAVTDGAVDAAKTFETKMELGSRYGMAGKVDNNGDGVMLEWDAQTKEFEKFVVGMTAAEVKAIKTQEANGHQIAVDEALLSAGCTIQIGEFVNAVIKACEDEQGMAFKTSGDIVLGLGVNNSDNGTSGDDFEATIKMNIDFAATVLVDGKIVAALNDAAQPELKVEDGVVVSKSVGKGADILKTKRELKEDYKMAAYGAPNVEGGTVKEWYIQSAAFSAHVVGMTADQVAAMETTEVNNHLISTDADLLSAGCTMQITGICAVVSQSAKNAR